MSLAGMDMPASKFAGRVLLAVASYNRKIVDQIEKGFREGIGYDSERECDERIDFVRVPGTLELAQGLQLCAARGDYSVLVALGCVLRGETYHFEIVCRTSADSLARLAASLAVPVINGILTCDDVRQAEVRALVKGGEFGRSASIMASLREHGVPQG